MEASAITCLPDCYIALVSRFSTCGSWEGHYILDCLKENESNIRPDTIHSDTQGQSTAIFGLAYLLGIQLMPRIRNWKEQYLYRPAPGCHYENIDALFSGNVDWDLIETMAPDMLRVAVSIQTGAMLPSDILRRLTSSSKKNKLYFALRELGRLFVRSSCFNISPTWSCATQSRLPRPKASGSIDSCNGCPSAEIA
jgi:TnpA family transposase